MSLITLCCKLNAQLLSKIKPCLECRAVITQYNIFCLYLKILFGV